MIGRPPPLVHVAPLPSNVVVVNERFTPETSPVQPSEVDVVLFPFPSPSLSHDADCLKWATPDHLIVFLGDPGNETSYGSPAFWEIARTLEKKVDLVDEQGRLLIMQKTGKSIPQASVKIPVPIPAPLAEKEKKTEEGQAEKAAEEGGGGEKEKLPKKGDRFVWCLPVFG